MTSNDSSRACSPLRARYESTPLKHPLPVDGSQPLALRRSPLGREGIQLDDDVFSEVIG